MLILKVEFCILAPSNILAKLAVAELLIWEINLRPATVFFDGGSMSSSNPRSKGPMERGILSSALNCKTT